MPPRWSGRGDRTVGADRRRQHNRTDRRAAVGSIVPDAFPHHVNF